MSGLLISLPLTCEHGLIPQTISGISSPEDGQRCDHRNVVCYGVMWGSVVCYGVMWRSVVCYGVMWGSVVWELWWCWVLLTKNLKALSV